MTEREAERLGEGEVQVLTPGRLGTHWLAQVGAYLAVPGLLAAQLVPGVDKEI